MDKVKRIAIGASAVGIMMSSMAGGAFAVSDNANQNACFGQGRAEYATTGSETVGYHASMRKGANAEMNAAYRDACQAAE